MNNRSDSETAEDQRCYRVPVADTHKWASDHWPVERLAFCDEHSETVHFDAAFDEEYVPDWQHDDYVTKCGSRQALALVSSPFHQRVLTKAITIWKPCHHRAEPRPAKAAGIRHQRTWRVSLLQRYIPG